MEKKRPLLPGRSPVLSVHLRIDMPIHYEKVQPSIVVVIKESCSPSKKWNRGFCDAVLIGSVRKIPGAIVPVQRVVIIRKGCVVQIDGSPMHQIACGNSHRRSLAPTLVQRITARKAVVLKGAIALVDVEVVWRRIICDQQIRFAVTVHIDKQRSQPVVAVRIGDAGMLTHVSEGAIPVVVKEMIGFAVQPSRATHHLHTSELAKAE